MIKAYYSIPERLHLVITGESGRPLSFVIERDRAAAVLGGLLGLLVLLTAGTWLGAQFFHQRNALEDTAASQAEELDLLHANFDGRLKNELAVREKKWRQLMATYEEMVRQLKTEKHEAASRFSEERGELVRSYEKRLAALTQSGSAKTAALQAELEREKRARQKLIERTAGRLDERSRMIEALMSRIGVEIKPAKRKTAANSGGPFVAASLDERHSEQLLKRSDRYIQLIQTMPLGRPAAGRITSGFGRRSDPFNGQAAFHAGIDFKGRVGEKVTATADGVVTKAGYDAGGFGHHVIVRHSGGYATLYGHLSAVQVKKGAKISRGDTVGLLGSSGRSTGPHLHYEIHHQGRPVNPDKHVAVASMAFAAHKH
jgi:murein DD-endopeptidase MepM/ murein hydrolase activator NlpD